MNMSNREELNKVMKDFDKQMNKIKILDKIEHSTSFRFKLKYALVFCFIFIVCGTMFLLKHDDEIMLSTNDIIKINETDHLVKQDLPVNQRVKVENKEFNNKEFYFLEQLIVPEDLKLNMMNERYVYTASMDSVYSLNEKDLFDYIVNYGNDETYVSIAYSKKGVTLSHYPFENGEVSKINHIEMIITEFMDEYFVCFDFNEFHFDIRCKNIEKEELLEVLKSLTDHDEN